MSTDRDSDPFSPPEISTEVCCIHCGETYDSWQIEWRESTDKEGVEHGFWCCPITGCDGKGFGFDILPTDPNYHDERGGWVSFDDDDEDDDGQEWDEDESEAWSEAPDTTPELSLDDKIPWDEPEPGPPHKGSVPDEDDFPFSNN